jgi:hypothetical protein
MGNRSSPSTTDSKEVRSIVNVTWLIIIGLWMVARRGVKKADKAKRNKIKNPACTEIYVQLHHSGRRNYHHLGHSMPSLISMAGCRIFSPYLPLSEAERLGMDLLS